MYNNLSLIPRPLPHFQCYMYMQIRLCVILKMWKQPEGETYITTYVGSLVVHVCTVNHEHFIVNFLAYAKLKHVKIYGHH